MFFEKTCCVKDKEICFSNNLDLSKKDRFFGFAEESEYFFLMEEREAIFKPFLEFISSAAAHLYFIGKVEEEAEAQAVFFRACACCELISEHLTSGKLINKFFESLVINDGDLFAVVQRELKGSYAYIKMKELKKDLLFMFFI